MNAEIMGMILSLIGMAITIVSFQARKKAMLLLLQSIGSAFYLVSYIFSGGGIAICLNVIYLIRNFLYTRIDSCSKKVRYITCICLCSAYVITYGIFTGLSGTQGVENLWNFLPIIGSIFGTVAALQVDMIRLRLLKVGDSLAWLAYNGYIGLGALGGILGEILNQISIWVAIAREKKARKAEKAQ